MELELAVLIGKKVWDFSNDPCTLCMAVAQPKKTSWLNSLESFTENLGQRFVDLAGKFKLRK